MNMKLLCYLLSPELYYFVIIFQIKSRRRRNDIYNLSDLIGKLKNLYDYWHIFFTRIDSLTS